MMSIGEREIERAMNVAYKEAGHNAYFGNGFKAGIKYMIEREQLLEDHHEDLKSNQIKAEVEV